MRLRIAVALPEKGGRPAIVVTEVRQVVGRGRDRWRFRVGHLERVAQQNIEGARERLLALLKAAEKEHPCAFIDGGTPQGVALWRSARKGWPKGLHRPHGYQRSKFDTIPFAAFLEAYADGRVAFREGLANRKELDRALVLYKGVGISKASEDLASEDEALVMAVCLSLMWPTHGPEADQVG